MDDASKGVVFPNDHPLVRDCWQAIWLILAFFCLVVSAEWADLHPSFTYHVALNAINATLLIVWLVLVVMHIRRKP